MIKTLLTAAAIALSVTAAHATQPIPQDLRGMWCLEGPTWSDSQEFRYNTCSAIDAGDELNLMANRYEGMEYGCRVVSVKTTWDPSIVVATKTPLGGPVYHVTGACHSDEGRGSDWREVLSMYITKGTLVVKTRQLRR